jgi:hypothetical protein
MHVDHDRKEIYVNFYNSLDNEYSFVIDEYYPFRPPREFYYNQISYIDTLKLPSQSFINQLKAINGSECFCCSSFMCRNNWGPAVGLNEIILEFKKNIEIKKQISKNI